MRRIGLLAASALLGLSLAACGGGGLPPSDSPPPPASGVATRTPLTGPPGCTKPIGDYETIIDRDVSTGYLSQNVYDRINVDLAAGPRAACAAGREADARAQLQRVKTSYGYR